MCVCVCVCGGGGGGEGQCLIEPRKKKIPITYPDIRTLDIWNLYLLTNTGNQYPCTPVTNTLVPGKLLLCTLLPWACNPVANPLVT